jgi:hypothetical protein
VIEQITTSCSCAASTTRIRSKRTRPTG